MLSSSYRWRNWISEVVSPFLSFSNWIFSLFFFLAMGNILWYTWLFCYPSLVLKGLYFTEPVSHVLTLYVSFPLRFCFPFCCHECLESPVSFHSLFYISKKLPLLKWQYESTVVSLNPIRFLLCWQTQLESKARQA